MPDCDCKIGKERNNGREDSEADRTDGTDNNDRSDADNDESTWELCSAYDHDNKFNPDEYLNGFYKSASEDTAMQIVLFFLPGLVYYLPETIETLLDLGAGPTVYVPIVFRVRALNIYSSDYAEVNRHAVELWFKGQTHFDWSNVCQWIASIEFTSQKSEEMQQMARQRLRAILKVNVHSEEVIEAIHYHCNNNGKTDTLPKQFQVVVSIFCLEYACETLDEYQKAVKNTVKLIQPGGYLVQGGVLNATEYSFDGKRFRCHTLTKKQLVNTLKDIGMETENKSEFKLIICDDVFVLFSKKKLHKV